MRKALVYVRVSTKGQEEGTSLESQEAACLAHAEKLGYTVGRITREVYSGAELHDRLLLARDRHDLRDFDALICYAIDRLSRDTNHLAVIVYECERANTELLFVTEVLDDTPQGRLIRNVTAFAAELEREKIRERSVRGKRTRALSGKLHNAGPELYGYRRDKAVGVRVIYEPEARIVRDIFQMINEGMGVRGVASSLNRQGIPAPGTSRNYSDGRSPRWGKSGIRRIIKHEAYKGEAVAWKWTRKKKRLVERPAAERISLPDGLVPAIVSADEWESAQKRLDTNTGERTRNIGRPYLLRGHIACAVCGQRMYPEGGTYRCSSRDKRGGRCGASPVPASECEEWVWTTARKAIEDPKVILERLEKLKDGGGQAKIRAEIAVRQKEITKLERGQQRLLRTLRDTEGMGEMIEAELRAIETEKGRARKVIAELGGKVRGEVDLKSIFEYCRQVSRKLGSCGFEQKRLTIEAVQLSLTAQGRCWEMKMDFAGVPRPSYSHYERNAAVVSFSNAA